MVSDRLFRIALCCLLLAPLVVAVTPAAGAPPPRPLCDACGESFEETADAHGVALAVERSDASVAVHENGSATWVVRNGLETSSSATRLGTNATLLTEIADRAMWDAELLGANVSGNDTVTLQYRDPAFADPSVGGALRSGAFTERYGYRNLDGLGADRLVVSAPDGTTVGWAVPGATVSDDGRRMTLMELDEGRVVTFVPDGAVLGPLWSVLAVGSLVGPLLVIQALAYVALPTAVFALLFEAAAGGRSWLERTVAGTRASPESALARVGALGVGLSVPLAVLLSPGHAVVAVLFGGGAAFGLLGAVLDRPIVRDWVTYRTLVGGAALGTLVGVGLAVGGIGLLARDVHAPSVASVLSVIGPVFVLLPAGYALGRGDRRLARATAGCGFVLATVPLLPVLPAPFGLGSLYVFVAVANAGVVAVVGLPVLVVGSALASREDDAGPDDSGSET